MGSGKNGREVLVAGQSAGVRHIVSYNQLGEEELMDRLQPETDEEREGIPLNLPFIVIVVDEISQT